MSRLEEVQHIPRATRQDARGWLLKILDGREDHLRTEVGECYVTWSEPGQIRGNHYHPVTSEWFTLIQGRAQLTLCDPETGERATMELDASEPVTVYVPTGLAHVWCTGADSGTLLIAYADHPYDPADTIPFGVL